MKQITITVKDMKKEPHAGKCGGGSGPGGGNCGKCGSGGGGKCGK